MSVSYKTNDPAVLSALAVFVTKRDQLAEQARLIGATFDGKPIFSNSVGDVSFAGLVLNNYQFREDKALWSTPDRDTKMSRPRMSRAPGTTKEQRQELRQRYSSMLPETVRFDAVWKSMGVDWGSLLFGGGYHMFELNGWLYFQSGAPVGEVMTEILGSEFNEAYRTYQQQKEAV